MALSTKVTVGIMLLALAGAGLTLRAQQPTFKTGTRTVAIYATVIDAQKRLVPNLAKEDFEILDNEKVQEIQVFINEVQPITVVVMLDTSASMTGNLKLLVAGNGIRIKEGSNAYMGTATLVAGAATVSTTVVSSNSRIFVTSQADGGTPGWLRISARVAATSFTITSSDGADTSTVAWLIIEPS